MEPDDLLQVSVDGAPYSIHHPARTTMRSKIAIPQDLCPSEQKVKIFKIHEFSKVLDEIQEEEQVLVVVTVKDLNWVKKLFPANSFLLHCSERPSQENAVHQWIAGRSDKKFLISDEWMVSGYEFHTVILIAQDHQMHGLSTVKQRAIAKLIVCQVSTLRFSHPQKVERIKQSIENDESIVKMTDRSAWFKMIGLVITLIAMIVIEVVLFIIYEEWLVTIHGPVVFGVLIMVSGLFTILAVIWCCWNFLDCCKSIRSVKKIKRISRQVSKESSVQQNRCSRQFSSQPNSLQFSHGFSRKKSDTDQLIPNDSDSNLNQAFSRDQ